MEPYFRYSCPVWGTAGINAINRLQKLQNRAARIVTNSAYDASALPIIRKLGWPTINELIESETLKMVYKSVNNQAPIYLTEMFVRLSDACKRELRNTKTDLAVPCLVANRLSARNAFHIRVLNYGTIFRLKSNNQNRMKYSKNVSTMPTPNADSLFHDIASIALIFYKIML